MRAYFVGNYVVKLLASVFFVGYFPFTSGTFASLVAVLIYLFIAGTPIYAYLVIFLFFLGVYVSAKAEVIFKQKDSHKIVIDEVVGFFIAMMFLPFNVWYVLAGFLVFRGLDIIKPYPAKLFQKFKGGFGVMLDDAVAGFYTNLILHIILKLW